jgi:ribonucleoside-diphosphate reductase alpha subunit
MSISMFVKKRNGKLESVNFDKIFRRLQVIGEEEHTYPLQINYHTLAMKLIDQLYDGIPTSQLDELGAEQCASLITTHYDYGILASLLLCSNHHKNTSNSYLDVVKELYNNTDVHGNHSPLLNDDIYNIVLKHHTDIQEMIDYSKDKLFDYFGFKTLERAYLLRIGTSIKERPQHMWMRVALSIHGSNMPLVRETYNALSNKLFTHATPTLYNAGTPKQQLSSCYLLAMENDSISGIYSTLADCAQISKWAGGIGLHVHNIRASGSTIRGTNGTSNGLVPMLRVYNNTARYVDQGGNKRNGSFAIYLSPEHADIENFLDLRKNHGDEESRARDLFYGLWIPDLFMKRVKENSDWTLMCPDECPGLNDVCGKDYERLYTKYERENKGRKTIKARQLWFKILESQIETGTPYLLYKDQANKKSNQQNLGTIKSSNLCTEIIEYSNDKETAVCNLASVAINQFVDVKNKTYNFEELGRIVEIVTNNLNKIIDVNYYPTEKTRRSNLLHRPIGIGVQGLADTFLLLDMPFESDEAKELNKRIFETIYYYSMKKSYEIAKERNIAMRTLYGTYKITREWSFETTEPDCNTYKIHNNDNTLISNVLEHTKPIYAEINNLIQDNSGSYSSFNGSPLSYGKFQFDLWGVHPSDRYDWDELRTNVKKYGVRNSLLVAPMPTASTSQILGNNECIEPITSNIYARRTNAGDFIMVNKYLLREMISMDKWNEDVKNSIIRNNGSVQHLDISDTMKEKYKTAWEIKMKNIIDMSRDRGAFVCQSQSLNLWVEEPTFSILTSMHFYAWEQGLKTGMYYLRTRAKAQAQQFTIEPEKKGRNDEPDEEENKVIEDNGENAEQNLLNELNNETTCDMCSG